MKKFLKEFFKRGLLACGGGPIILAIVYFCLGKSGVVLQLDVDQVVLGIVSSAVMAFVAAGISAIYQVERLPLMFATIIQAVVLYIDYLGIYLLNGWLANGIVPLLVFTAIFVVGFAAIWISVVLITKHHAKKLNQKLSQQN